MSESYNKLIKTLQLLFEIFNYLLELTVQRIRSIDIFQLITATKPKDNDVVQLYINGEQTPDDSRSKVKMTEIELKRLMFDVQDVWHV